MAFCVVSYDISIDKRRNRVAKLLEGFGSRVQYSVFECDLTSQQYAQLAQRLNRILRPAEGDNVRIYQLCAGCVKTVTLVGTGELETTPDVYIV